MITYKRPTKIEQKLTKYKNHALNKTHKQTNDGSRPCKRCALCGCHRKYSKSMVQLITKNKTFTLIQKFTRANLGIRETTCVIWREHSN